MDAVWDVLRWGGLVVGIVLCIVHVLFSLLFLWLIFSEKAQLWQRGMCLSLSLGCLYLPIYGIGTCMGLLLSSGCFWFAESSLFGAGRPFFVPSPAVRFPG